MPRKKRIDSIDKKDKKDKMDKKDKKGEIDFDPECIVNYRMYEKKDKNEKMIKDLKVFDPINILQGQYQKDDEGNEYLNNYKLPLSEFYNEKN